MLILILIITLIFPNHLFAGPTSDPQSIEFYAYPHNSSSGNGDRLQGKFFLPNTAGPYSAIVALHGCLGFYPDRDLSWASYLTSLGHAVLYPDSFTTRKILGLCHKGSASKEKTIERFRDAWAALRWLGSQPNILPNQIALMGWSHGGTAALLATDQRLSPKPSDIKIDFQAIIGFYPHCPLLLSKKHWRPKRPTYIFHGEKDNWSKAKDCQKLVQQNSNGPIPLEIKVYPNAYHDFDVPNLNKTIVKNLSTSANNGLSATLEGNLPALIQAQKDVADILKKYLSVTK